MLDASVFLETIDKLFEQNKVKEAETYMLDSLQQAEEAGEMADQLQILNELIGYYRQTSQKDALKEVMEKSILVAQSLGLSGTVAYATTAVNVANGYRSIGELEKSLQYYQAAEQIYSDKLEKNDMRLAGFFNNISLLHQERKEYDKAQTYLLKALEIVIHNHSDFEIAVTYANLANTMVAAGKYESGKDYAQKAVECFDKIELHDPHYCAALSALGMCLYHEGSWQQAYEIFDDAMNLVENTIGKNSQYMRLLENRNMCETAMKTGEKESVEKNDAKKKKKKKEEKEVMKGLKLCKEYYETYGKPMIAEKFPEYVSKIAVGLVGEGSDCMGYDDEISRDHDWGPSFCIWVSDETYNEIGEQLTECYEKLPTEFKGYVRSVSMPGKRRRGVMTISAFYKNLVGAECYENIDWRNVQDYALAAAVNGEVFTDPEGTFTKFRNQLQKGYPEDILYLKLAEDVAHLSQTGQYNFFRVMERGDRLTADRMLVEGMGYVMQLVHHMYQVYPPHDKWLYKSFLSLDGTEEVAIMLNSLHKCLKEENEDATSKARDVWNRLGEYLARELYAKHYISDIDDYLDSHTEELVKKSVYATYSDEKLVEEIVKIEFTAFDQVKNEGGRAYCQNDWPTFLVMRKSQYLTWNRTMLMQYLYDFSREYEKGHNLITEKYGRMMESTSPEKYEELKKHFPVLTEQKKAIIEQIVAIQMEMMESFAKDHPKVAGNARTLHTYEDQLMDTSYETYLRGEISTYSDKMLQLYGGYVVQCASEGINIARVTIENTARLYGYPNLDTFEREM